MKLNPTEWAENLYSGVESRIKLAIKHRKQVFQILAAMAIFTISMGSLQYIPFLVSWLHISDILFGKILVYSLPVWIIFALFMIWRS